MRPSILLLLAALPIFVACSTVSTNQKAGFIPKDPALQVKEMGRGVNILGYDPFWRDESKARFKEAYFERIRSGGFQTVRVNLHAFRHMDAENRLDPEWLKKLDWVVDRALANGLIVILDEHDYHPAGTDATNSKPRLMSFWRQVSERYKDKPASVVFELLNEPNGQLTDEVWNSWLVELLGVIREANPQRNVIIGPASWNNINSLAGLKLPKDDRHIIVTVHYYLPMRFTHQGARWSKNTAHLSGITWGSREEREQLKRDLAGVQDWSRANGRPIFLGEFGAYDKGDIDSRVAYTSAVARTAEANGWAWAYWQFDSDFIVFDVSKDDWNQPIYKALIP